MRDYLDAIRSRVVVFDGGMGATLEQFDLSLERRLPASRARARGARAQPARRHRGRPRLDARRRRRRPRDRLLPGLAPQARGVGPGRPHARDQPSRRARSPARPSASTASWPGSIGPTGHLPASDDPTLGAITFRELVDVFAEQAQRPRRGRRRPAHHRDRAGHPRGQGGDLRRARGVPPTRPLRPDPVLGLAAAQRRQDAAGHRHQRRARRRSRRCRSTRSA